MIDFIKQFFRKPASSESPTSKPPPPRDNRELLSILDVCLRNRDQLVRYFEAIDHILKNAVVGGQNRIEKYIKALSGLIYSPENIVFDLVLKNPKLISPEQRDWFKEQLLFLFNQGIDVQLYKVIYDALTYGVAFVKIVYYNDEPHIINLHPSDVLLYYPELDLDDEEQVIVLVNRLPYRLFLKKYAHLLKDDNVVVFPENRKVTLSEWGTLSQIVEKFTEKAVIYPETTRIELAPLQLTLESGDTVEFYEMYYRNGDNYYMALIYNNHVFYNGLSPYVGALSPVISFTFQESKTVYGDTILRHLTPVLQRLKEVYDFINALVEISAKPPLVITGMNVGLTEEEIQNAIRAGGVVILTDPSAKFDQYVPKINIEVLVGMKQELEAYLDSVLMINEAIATGQIRNVRSASQLALYIQTIMSDIKFTAIRFEQFIEKLMTQIAYTLAIHNPQYSMFNVDMYVDVFAHSSSPIVYQTRMEQVITLVKAGVLDPEDLLDIIPVPNKDKIKTKLKEREQLQKVAILNEMVNNNKKEGK